MEFELDTGKAFFSKLFLSSLSGVIQNDNQLTLVTDKYTNIDLFFTYASDARDALNRIKPLTEK